MKKEDGMQRMWRSLLVVLLCVSVSLAGGGKSLWAQKPFGVNLCGAEFDSVFPGRYGTDYIYPTASLDYYAHKGFRLVRLPFRWERIQPVLFAPLDSAELARMRHFVDQAAQRGMQVVLDMHNYGRRYVGSTPVIIGSPAVPAVAFADCWQRLATVFRSHPGIWGYGLMNEPHDQLPEAPWHLLAQQAINAIRQVDTTTPILIAGDQWSNATWWWQYSDHLRLLVDPAHRLIFEAHVYFDDDFSGRYDESYDQEGAYPEIGVDRVTPFVEWLQFYGLQGFVGEYGVPDDDPRWLEVLARMLTYLQEHCVNGAYWAGGPWWGEYPLSVEPDENGDKPQMGILEKFLFTSDSCVVAVSQKTDTQDPYPNPCRNVLTVPATPGSILTIWSVRGELIKRIVVPATQMIWVEALPTGMYVLRTAQGQAFLIVKL